MANDARRISDLAVANTIAKSDRLVALVNPSTTANVLTITLSSIQSIIISNSVPANSSSPGTPPQIAYDANNLYVCVANNRWVKTGLVAF